MHTTALHALSNEHLCDTARCARDQVLGLITHGHYDCFDPTVE